MIKLMIVDDEEIIREGLTRYIPWGNIGIDIVESAPDGYKALEAAARLQPDIILCDIKLPDINGIELAGKFKDILPECKIIFLSAYADKEYLKSAINLKAFNYLEKPIGREEVMKALNEAVRIIADERKKSEESGFIYKEKLALNMINKQIAPEEIDKWSRSLHLTIPLCGDFITAIVKIDQKSDLQQRQKEEVLRSIAAISIHKQIEHIEGFKDSNHILIHFYGKEIGNHFFTKEWLIKIQESFEAVLGEKINLFAGIGKHAASVEGIYESYQTAVMALQNQFFIGHDGLFIYEAMDENICRVDDAVVKQFQEFLKKDEKGNAIAFISNLGIQYRKCSILQINLIKDIFFKILLCLKEFAEEFNVDLIEEQSSKEFLWEIISGHSFLMDIVHYVIDRIEFVFNKLGSIDSIGQNVYNIMQYIHEHFSERDLTINTIARHMYLAPTYICNIFKSKTGKTINQFITEVRIEKAKEILRKDKVKLLEISNQVGYLSSNHFTKTFRKMTGMNPSDFRERHYQ